MTAAPSPDKALPEGGGAASAPLREAAAKVISDALGVEVNPLDINAYDANTDGEISEDEVAASFRAYLEKDNPGASLETDYWEKQLDKDKLDEIASSTDGSTYILARAEGVHGGQHWVVLTGYTVSDGGQVLFNYSGTSDNDEGQGRHYILGDKTEGQGDNYFRISKVETYTIKRNI